MTSKTEHVRELTAAGFRLFPVVPDGKTPAVRGWQTLATNDAQKAAALLDAHPGCNIGIDTSENLLVVDVDDKAGKSGSAEILRLELAGFELPETREHRTATGGRHLIYRTDSPVKQGANVLAPGLDIRARGGYIVAPGSTINGGAYEVLRGCPIAPAPAWLVEKCGEAKPKTAQDAAPVAGVDLASATRRAAHYLASEAAPAIEGAGGDETTLKAAMRARDFGVDEAGCIALMLEHFNPRCAPPWTGDELAAKVSNAYRYGRNAPGVASPEADFGPAAPPPEPASANPFRAKSPAEFRLRTVNDELVSGLIDRGTVSGLIATHKAGKSWIALDLCLSIARGRPWFGRKVRQGPAVFIAAEGSTETEMRALALMAHHGDDPAAIPFRCISASPDLLNGTKDTGLIIASVEAVAKECRQRVELIVIDTLRQTMHRGDENGSDMADYARNVRHLANETGAHVMVLHHTGKDPTKGARGHSSLGAELDSILLLSAPDAAGKNGKLVQSAQRARACGLPIDFALVPIQAMVRGETINTVAPVPTGADAAEEFGRPASLKPGTAAHQAYCVLKEITESADRQPSAGAQFAGAPEGRRAVSEKEFRDALRKRTKAPLTDKSRMSAFSKSYARSKKMLLSGGHIGFSEGYLWVT